MSRALASRALALLDARTTSPPGGTHKSSASGGVGKPRHTQREQAQPRKRRRRAKKKGKPRDAAERKAINTQAVLATLASCRDAESVDLLQTNVALMTQYFQPESCPALDTVREQQAKRLERQGVVPLVGAGEEEEEEGMLDGLTDEQIREMLQRG